LIERGYEHFDVCDDDDDDRSVKGCLAKRMGEVKAVEFILNARKLQVGRYIMYDNSLCTGLGII